MRKLLWVGDAACDSGFARCTHQILDVLRQSWDVSVLGLNYRGDPHSYPYHIYPAWPGGDLFGVGRIKEVVDKVKPNCVVIQNDPWNIPAYMKEIRGGPFPIVGALAVDGKNCMGRGLNDLTLAIFWTRFAAQEAREGGYHGAYDIVPLGVDLNVYTPGDRVQARKDLLLEEFSRLPEDAFIVGNVNRNQPRKRLDLTIRYFAKWAKQFGHKNAYLFLHVAPTGDMGYDCGQLVAYYGMKGRLILAEPDVFKGPTEDLLAKVYRSFDVQVSTTQGEGWGLTTMEGMACGVPQIVPDWSALGEWCEESVVKIPCTSTICTPNKINVVGGIADEDVFIMQLERLYQDAALRNELGARGRALVSRPEYRWPAIGKAFATALERAL
jgi:D-inositol-3-phosphate glycosyltransferase